MTFALACDFKLNERCKIDELKIVSRSRIKIWVINFDFSKNRTPAHLIQFPSHPLKNLNDQILVILQTNIFMSSIHKFCRIHKALPRIYNHVAARCITHWHEAQQIWITPRQIPITKFRRTRWTLTINLIFNHFSA